MNSSIGYEPQLHAGQVFAVGLGPRRRMTQYARPGAVVGLVLHRGEQVDERGHDRIGLTGQPRDNRTETRPPFTFATPMV